MPNEIKTCINETLPNKSILNNKFEVGEGLAKWIFTLWNLYVRYSDAEAIIVFF